MIEVTFLGTGSAMPPRERGNTTFAVRTEQLLFLADAGPSVFGDLQRAGIEPAQIDTIFLSHGHADHVLGFPQLALLQKFVMREPPPRVYCTASVREILGKITELTFPEASDMMDRFNWIELAEGPRQSHDLTPDIQLTTEVVFGPPYMPVLGLRLDFFDKGVSLAFSSDTAPSDAVASLAHNCDLLIHEASFSATLQPDVSPELLFHSDARQAGQIAARANAKRLALVHLNNLHTNHRRVLTAEAAETFSGLILVPDDGDVVQLDTVELTPAATSER
ncbi:MAG TPA: MBL fold metallo-hydrolase [Anaerolineae bacterium]|nr:MBL fold metallo-hydrolase [Anaerolineae bacterium]